MTDDIEKYLRQQIPKDELVTILDNIGLPYSGINLSYSNSGVIGTSDAEILVGLNRGASPSHRGYIRKLREELPRRFPGVEFFFQPADIVTQILNFGLPAPIDIQVTGADMQGNYFIAQQIANRMKQIPGTADVHVQQMLTLPTLDLHIDRTKVTQVGMNARDVAQSVLVSLSGSFQTTPELLAESQERSHLPGCGAVPAIPCHLVAGLDGDADQRPQRAELSGPEQSGRADADSQAGGGFPLQRAACDRRLRQHAGPRSGRGGQGHDEGPQTLRGASAARHAHHRSRPGRNHAVVFPRPGNRTGDGDRAGLFPDRRELPVVA